MALIKYTQFIGIRAAENTVFNTTYNSTNYSMLVVFMDGTASIVEGDANAMAPYLPFLKEDNMEQVLRDALAQMENNLEKMVDTRIERIFAVNHPIPDVIGMREDEAVAKLTAAGFTVKFANTYPEGLPQGVVKDYHRENDNYLTVLLDVRHELPNVVGMPADEALLRLRNLGFRVQLVNGEPARGKVFSCTRADETGIDVELDARLELPNVLGLPEQEALSILKNAGFITEVVHQDPLNVGCVVDEIIRSNPVSDRVTVCLKSVCDLTGKPLAEVLQMLEQMGTEATIVRKVNNTPPEHVYHWEGSPDAKGVTLWVSLGSDDLSAASVTVTGVASDGEAVEFKNATAILLTRGNQLELSMEMKVDSKNRHQFADSLYVTLNGKSVWGKVESNLKSMIMNPGEWHKVKIRLNQINAKALPETAMIEVGSSYGVFKKQTAWNMAFDFKW